MHALSPQHRGARRADCGDAACVEGATHTVHTLPCSQPRSLPRHPATVLHLTTSPPDALPPSPPPAMSPTHPPSSCLPRSPHRQPKRIHTSSPNLPNFPIPVRITSCCHISTQHASAQLPFLTALIPLLTMSPHLHITDTPHHLQSTNPTSPCLTRPPHLIDWWQAQV